MQIQTFIYKYKGGSYWLDGEAMDHHIQRMLNSGWELMNSANDTGHVRLGKTLTLTALTGGLNLFFGASRSAQTMTLTFKKEFKEQLHESGLRCLSCGTGIPTGGVFCPRCGASAARTGRAGPATQRAANAVPLTKPVPELSRSAPVRPAETTLGAVGYVSGHLTRYLSRHPLVAFVVLVGFCLFLVWTWQQIPETSPEPSKRAMTVTEQAQVKPIMDLPSLALRKRAEVERELGKPSRYIRKTINELADEADYPWGIAGYNQSRLNFVILRFQTTPKDYREAFGLLNLPHPNPPFVAVGGDGTRQPFWRARTYGTEYTCCGNIAAQDIWISSDWKEMHILILDLDDPGTWLDQQCTMYVERTGLPLPRGARWRGDPLRRPIVQGKKSTT